MWFEQMHLNWRQALVHYAEPLQKIEAVLVNQPRLVPTSSKVMAAFETDPNQINVVILGQDPYPTPGAAIGQAFAVDVGVKMPASLKNIAAELKADVGSELSDPTLKGWQMQGVWLLNTCLTTLENQPGAHLKLGWQELTTAALRQLTAKQPLVILAWGKPALKLAHKVKTDMSSIVISAHPSPLSAHRGFLGSKPFSRANHELRKLGLSPIDW